MGIGRATHTVDTRSKELIEDIVFVGGHNEMLNGQAHHAGHVTSADIAKISTWHTEADFLIVILRGLKIACKVIDHLSQQARPVDGVDSANFVLALERQIIAHGLDNVLAIIEHALDGNVVNVGIEQAEHLRLLKWAHATLRAGHEDSDPFLAAHGVLGGATCVTRSSAEDIELCIAPIEFVLKQVTKQLHGHVFEGQCRAVRKSLQIDNSTKCSFGFERLDGHNFRRPKTGFGVRFLTQSAQIVGRYVINVQRQHFEGQCGIALRAEYLTQTRQLCCRYLRVGLRQVQTTIRRQAF